MRIEPLLQPGHAPACASAVPHRQDRCFRYPVTVFAAAPAPMLAATRWKGSCSARCRYTGRRCALPADGHEEHASGRMKFTAVAAPGQLFFPKQAELDDAAAGRPESLMDGGR